MNILQQNYDRVDNEKPYVGMTNFKGDYVTIYDVKIAKNYLSEIELQRLNLLVSQFQIYREREMKELQSDFDMLMKSLPNKKDE